MKEGAPVRFLILLVGGWTCLRIATLAAGWWGEAAPPSSSPLELADPTATTALVAARAATADAVPSKSDVPSATSFRLHQHAALPPPALASNRAMSLPTRMPFHQSEAVPASPPQRREELHAGRPISVAQTAPSASSEAPIPTRRWSGSAWLLARREGGVALAPRGTLGGSQAGARLLYRLNDDASRPLALSVRAYVPIRRATGAEAAIGFDWRPIARAPIHLLVERRQRLGREGRSTFSLTVYGGGSADLGRGWRLEGYAQTGVVGARSRDGFVDGSVRLSHRIGPVEGGGGLWGAAQPGASRLDIGPHVSLPIRAHGASLRLSAEYRFRIAGDAVPSSGPALTLGADF
ncbi:hypothetical protein [Sphingosinicella sp.]|uniref:hypothetical protein n=1 Tax=Sphingosinicella sp. TaxID=1917971 RepID=UPI004037BA7F